MSLGFRGLGFRGVGLQKLGLGLGQEGGSADSAPCPGMSFRAWAPLP